MFTDHGGPLSRSCLRALHDCDLLVGEFVEFVDEAVDLAVGGVDLALDGGFVVVSFGVGALLVEGEHTVHEFDHLVVAGLVLRVLEVDGADRELFDVLREHTEEATAQSRANLLEV